MKKLNMKDVYGNYKLPKIPMYDYQLHVSGKNYWYIVAKAQAGKNARVILLGPYTSEDKAYEVATDKLNSAFKVLELNTRDRGAATQMIRHRVLNESGDIETSIRRMKHQI